MYTVTGRNKIYCRRLPLKAGDERVVALSANKKLILDRHKSADHMAMASIFSQIAPITDHLYLCSAMAITPEKLQMKGITHVVNATLDFPAMDPKRFETVRISVDDVPHSQLGVYFDKCADWIHRNKQKNGKTLVHCMAGVSRSSSICLAYLMKYHRMTLRQAHDHVKKRRSVIRPNCGFWKQLVDFEKKLFGKNSVHMVTSAMGYIPDIYQQELRGNAMWVTTYNSSFGGNRRR